MSSFKQISLASLVFAGVLSGCAMPSVVVGPGQLQAEEETNQKSFVTGSRLPVKNGKGIEYVKGLSKQGFAEEMLHNKAPMTDSK